jgi:hypothetical protein
MCYLVLGSGTPSQVVGAISGPKTSAHDLAQGTPKLDNVITWLRIITIICSERGHVSYRL